MKIGYLLQAGAPDLRANPFSGPSVHVRQVIEELRAMGHTVSLLVQWDEEIFYSRDLETFELVTVPSLDRGPFQLFERGVRRVQYELQLPYLALFESLRFAAACRQLLTDCDILYERMGWMAYGGSLAGQWLRIPHVLEVNGDHLPELEALGIAPQGSQKWLSVTMTKYAIARTSYVVAAGEGWRSSFIKRWQVNPSKISVVENGSKIVDLLKREDLRSFSDLPRQEPNEVTVAYVGGFQAWHGLSILIKAVAKVISQGIPVKLMLIGSGSTSTEIHTLVETLGIGDYVQFTGRLTPEQLAHHLAGADIGASPYCGWAEYAGLKLLDYKAAGLATIASGANGQPTVLEHGRTGWIVPPCDIDALAEAIRFLSCNGELRRKIGHEARLDAERRHRWFHTAHQLAEIFDHLVQPQTRSNVKSHVNCNAAR